MAQEVRRRLLRQAEAAEAKFRGLLESAPDATVISDSSGRIALVNRQAEQLFGYCRAELLGQPVELLIPERFHANHVRDRARYQAAPQTRPMGVGLELFGRRKDGGEFSVEISLSSLETDQGRLVTSSIRDITQRKQADQALRESEERFRLLVDGVRDYAVYLLTPDGHVASWNVGAERLKGYRAEDIVGEHVSRFYSPQDVQQRKPQRDLQLAASEGRAQDEGWRVRKDGSRFWANAVLTALRDETGKLRGFAKVTQDITERKLADEQLRQTAAELARSNTELEQFAYVASHDLQEPLRMVASYTQLLARRYRGQLDCEADEFIGFAVDGALRMQTLINDLLAYSRVGTRGKPFAATDVNEVFDEVLGDLAAVIEERRAIVSRGELPTVQADRSQLTQVLQNLIANAIKFSGTPPCRVHTEAKWRRDEWLFAVRDNGIGIKPEYAERVFVMFQRLHTQGEYPGTGIGLAICKKIVERHGGRIWVESQPGEGATFYFTLPARYGHDA